MANKTVFNNYGDLKDKAQKRIEELGGTVLLQLTTAKKLHVPGRNPGTWEHKAIYNSTYSIPVRDRVRIGNEVINSALITEYDGDGNPKFDSFWFNPEETEGILMLRSRIDQEERIAEYLLIGNLVENGVNPDRDKSKAIFKIIDRTAIAQEKMERLDAKMTAFMAAAGMDENRVREFAAAMGWNERDEFKVLRSSVIEQAEQNPEWFNKFIDGNGVEYRSLLKNAITAGIVSYEPTTKEIRWANGETIMMLGSMEGADYLEQWAKAVIAHPDGRKKMEEIKKQLSKPKK